MGQKLAKEGTLQQGLSIVCNSLYHAVLSAVTSNANIPRGAIWQKVKTRPLLVGSFFFFYSKTRLDSLTTSSASFRSCW